MGRLTHIHSCGGRQPHSALCSVEAQAGMQRHVQRLDCAIVPDLYTGRLRGRRPLDLDTGCAPLRYPGNPGPSRARPSREPGPSRGKPGKGRLAGATPPACNLPGKPARDDSRASHPGQPARGRLAGPPSKGPLDKQHDIVLYSIAYLPNPQWFVSPSHLSFGFLECCS